MEDFYFDEPGRLCLLGILPGALSKTKARLEARTNELKYTLESTEIAQLRQILMNIDNKIELSNDENTAVVEKFREKALSWHLKPEDLQESLQELSTIRLTRQSGLQLGSSLVVRPRTYADAETQTDRNMSIGFFSAVELPTEIFPMNFDGLEYPRVKSSTTKMSKPQEVDNRTGQQPETALLQNPPETNHGEVIPMDRTPSMDRPLTLLRRVSGETIDNIHLSAEEFVIINLEYPEEPFVLRCPCRRLCWKQHPFEQHRALHHFCEFHLEVFGDEIPTERFVFENYSRKVIGMPPSAFSALAMGNEHNLDLTKESETPGSLDVEVNGSNTASDSRDRPILPSDMEAQQSPAVLSELVGDEDKALDNIEVFDGDYYDDCSDEEEDDEIDYLDSEYAPDEQYHMADPIGGRGEGRVFSAPPQTRASRDCCKKTYVSPVESLKRNRSTFEGIETPRFIYTFKTSRLHELKTNF
ncbi:hypothetical protein BKA67DRAFT_664392 [Truncatella angustata]|uniref:Uncharacterized protein n=1 Tax=Truncatella angustata TaxID=152316 RepID=A0A9P8U8K1_9PEZI|nr:uncharacterized protein BKA67DRAFT_664392 [Truncatella angustata]KAH6645289.1 hypothetical protein BKA67DRAFT_664392 [Truncatella angustata]KAH8203332.1 hypothetical protein TruAng_002528 [Truncatella angustata]